MHASGVCGLGATPGGPTMIYSLRQYLFLVILAGILSAGFHWVGLVKGAPLQIFYSDIAGFFQQASAPGFPYLEKNIEYPPLIGIFMHWMGQLGKTQVSYYILSVLFLIFFAALATYFLYKILPAENRDRLIIYWIFAPSMLVFLTYNWDIISILFVAAAFYFVRQNRYPLASGFLALGASAKLYPILYLAPLFLKAKDWTERIKIAGVSGLTLLAVNLPFMLENFSGWSYFWRLNAERNSNPDSIWTIARFFFRNLDISDINIFSLVLFLGAAGFLLWKFRQESFLKLCFGLTIIFLLFNKVFTPQYLMWLLPFFVLMPELKKNTFYALEFSNLAVLFSILPWFFVSQDILYFYLASPFVILRHLILIYLIFSKNTGFGIQSQSRRKPIFFRYLS